MNRNAGKTSNGVPASSQAGKANGWAPLLYGCCALFLASFAILGLGGCAPSRATQGRSAANPPSVQQNVYTNAGPLAGAPGTLATNQPASGSAFLSEELWIVARPADTHAPPLTNDVPGTGAFMARTADGEREVPLLLKHTDVKAKVSAYIASVEVTQQFQNSYDHKIDATYVFPLPHNAAVNGFIITIGDRLIRGIIRERKEAEQIFAEARRQGYTASLFTQDRPNLFKQAVKNIEPGKEIGVVVRYLHTLSYDDGWYEYVFPMIIGPRFNPPAGANEAVSTSGQPGVVDSRNPTERSGLDIALQLEVDAGLAIEETQCRSHVVEKDMTTPEKLFVKLSRSDLVPNRDFIFRYRAAGGRIKPGLLTHRDDRGGFFTLMLFPPQTRKELKRQPLEMVFVLDCASNLSGRPLEQAKEAVARGLRLLEPEDSFQIVACSRRALRLGPAPLIATPQNIERGLAYLSTLNAEGATQMTEGIQVALDFPRDSRRLRFVVLLTDGFSGHESEILGEVQKRLGESRLFSFGVGASVNRHLLEGLARLGKGAVAYVAVGDSATDVMDRFYQRVSYPAMTEVKLDWGGLHVSELYPKRVPDLFVGRPVVLTGRFEGKLPAEIRVTGQTANEPVAVSIPVHSGAGAARHPGLASVWARQKISDLSDQVMLKPKKELFNEIKQLALDYGLLSDFTAFVAVDSIIKRVPGISVTVPDEVSAPEAVKPQIP